MTSGDWVNSLLSYLIIGLAASDSEVGIPCLLWCCVSARILKQFYKLSPQMVFPVPSDELLLLSS